MPDPSLTSPFELHRRLMGDLPLNELKAFSEVSDSPPPHVHRWPQESHQDTTSFLALWIALRTPGARVEVLAQSHDDWMCFRGYLLDLVGKDPKIQAITRDCGPHRVMIGNSQVHRVRNTATEASFQGMRPMLIVIIGAGSSDPKFAALAEMLRATSCSETRTVELW